MTSVMSSPQSIRRKKVWTGLLTPFVCTSENQVCPTVFWLLLLVLTFTGQQNHHTTTKSRWPHTHCPCPQAEAPMWNTVCGGPHSWCCCISPPDQKCHKWSGQRLYIHNGLDCLWVLILHIKRNHWICMANLMRCQKWSNITRHLQPIPALSLACSPDQVGNIDPDLWLGEWGIGSHCQGMHLTMYPW